MHVQEKRAWYILIVLLTAFALYGVMVAFVGFHPGARGVFGIMGLAGFAGFIGKKSAIIDERDKEIARKSVQAAFGIFWAVFLICSLAPMFFMDSDAVISVEISAITFLPFPAMVLFLFSQSLTTIVLYRRGGDA